MEAARIAEENRKIQKEARRKEEERLAIEE